MTSKQEKQNTTQTQKPKEKNNNQKKEYYTKNQYWIVKAKNKPGRPTKEEQRSKKISNTLKEQKSKIPEHKIQKIQDGFLKGLKKSEIFVYANISSQTYYNRKAKKPELFGELESLQANPTIQSKINIANKINNDQDIKLSQRRLENSKDSEFNNKAQQNNIVQQNNYYNLSEEELDAKMQELQDKLNSSQTIDISEDTTNTT